MIDKTLLKDIRRIQFKMEKLVTDIFQGAYKSRFKGRGMEFEEVREYVAGDEIRTIDWNVTAKMQAPYVKIFKEERELTVMLMVDLSASGNFGTVSKNKKEIMAEIGALLAFSALRNNDKIGLILFTDQIELFVPPKKGVRHVLRIVREILAFNPMGKKTNLKEALSFFGKVMSRSCICFLISDFIAADYEKELKLTARRHDLIGLKIFDEKEMEYPDLGLVELTDLETGEKTLVDTSSGEIQAHFKASAAKRANKVASLFKMSGSPLIEINTGKSYIDPLMKYFKAGKYKT